MTAIDDFASTLLEESKRFLEHSTGGIGEEGRDAYLHAALVLAFCALEAHIYAISEDFAGEKSFTPHELGILQERQVQLKGGQFELTASLQIARLEDRLQFLHRRFTGAPIDTGAGWWAALHSAVALRNQLTHPKAVPTITTDAVSRAIEAIISTLDVLYKAVYGRGFPMAAMRLHSRLNF